MADWDTTFKDDDENASSLHSRQSSESSGISTGNKENKALQRLDSEEVSTEDSEKDLILREGKQLREESVTESILDKTSSTNGYTYIPEIPSRLTKPLSNGSPGTAKAKAAKSPFAASTIESIPEEEISIPNDGNLSSFTADQIANFFRCLKIDDRIISHLHRKKVDGKRFAKLKDSELEAVGMKNHPVILFFKEKSGSKAKKSNGWSL